MWDWTSSWKKVGEILPIPSNAVDLNLVSSWICLYLKYPARAAFKVCWKKPILLGKESEASGKSEMEWRVYELVPNAQQQCYPDCKSCSNDGQTKPFHLRNGLVDVKRHGHKFFGIEEHIYKISFYKYPVPTELYWDSWITLGKGANSSINDCGKKHPVCFRFVKSFLLRSYERFFTSGCWNGK